MLRAKQICVANEGALHNEAREFLLKPQVFALCCACAVRVCVRPCACVQTEMDKEQIHHDLPQYDGVISSILNQHLNRYISVERAKAEEIVMSARNETFSVLAEDGSLTEMYEGGATKKSSQRHKSCELLLVAIRQGFKKCLQISKGQQLVDLLCTHQQYLGQYREILEDLTREALPTNTVMSVSASQCRQRRADERGVADRALPVVFRILCGRREEGAGAHVWRPQQG